MLENVPVQRYYRYYISGTSYYRGRVHVAKHRNIVFLGFQKNRATPSHHPFFHGILHEINHPAIGVSPIQENPFNNHILTV